MSAVGTSPNGEEGGFIRPLPRKRISAVSSGGEAQLGDSQGPGRALPGLHVFEGLQEVPGEELQLAQVGRHRVQEDVLDPSIDPLLYSGLDLIYGSGQIDGFDVVPGTLVRNDRQHVPLLFRDRLVVVCPLAQPAEVLVTDGEALLLARRAPL